jgi:hypothetical protein
MMKEFQIAEEGKGSIMPPPRPGGDLALVWID